MVNAKSPNRSRDALTVGRWLAGMMAMLLLQCAGFPAGADEWFMKIEGIKGESTHERLRDWTRLQSVSTIVQRPSDGPTTFSCEVKKAFDVSSPALLQSCGKGEHHRRATLAYVLTKPGATQYRIAFENVMVASLAQNGPGTGTDGIPGETLSLSFQKIEWNCLTLDESGGNTGGLTAVIDAASGEGRLKPRRPFRASVERQEGRSGVLVTTPVEAGHRYQIFSRPSFGQAWTVLTEFTATEDGDSSQFIPMSVPTLFLRVEEAD